MENFNKYDLENIPISEEVKEGAKQGNSSDMLHVLLRAMSMLEFNLEEAVLKINQRFDKVEADVECLKRGQKRHSSDIRKLDARLTEVEKQIA